MLFTAARRITKTLAVVFIATILLGQSVALASPYGSDQYGDCKYSLGCDGQNTNTTSGNNSTSNTDTSTSTNSNNSLVLLNSFDEFFTSAGKELSLSQNQVIYFEVTTSSGTVRYSITINKVGDGFVDITITPSSINSRLFISDAKQFDVDTNGSKDIEISLNGISANGRAIVTFRSLKAAEPKSTTNPQPAKSGNWLWLIIPLIVLISGIIWLIGLTKRRKRDKE